MLHRLAGCRQVYLRPPKKLTDDNLTRYFKPSFLARAKSASASAKPPFAW